MIKSDYIVFDTETGGLDETKNPITQYAAVILDGRTLKEIDRWETFVKPYGNLVIEKQALESTMVSMSDINRGIDVRTFVDTAKKFWEIHISNKKTKKRESARLVPVGHNVVFDNRFINAALSFCGESKDITEWMYPNILDTFSLAKLAFGVLGDEKLNLGASCERAKIKLTDAHGAMNDVEATADLLRWYMKKLRTQQRSFGNEANSGRPLGTDFFEFKCAALIDE